MEKDKLRFDVELDSAELEKLDSILEKCYRSRKNFAEALIKLVIQSDGVNVDLTKLGIIK